MQITILIPQITVDAANQFIMLQKYFKHEDGIHWIQKKDSHCI